MQVGYLNKSCIVLYIGVHELFFKLLRYLEDRLLKAWLTPLRIYLHRETWYLSKVVRFFQNSKYTVLQKGYLREVSTYIYTQYTLYILT